MTKKQCVLSSTEKDSVPCKPQETELLTTGTSLGPKIYIDSGVDQFCLSETSVRSGYLLIIKSVSNRSGYLLIIKSVSNDRHSPRVCCNPLSAYLGV